MSAFVVLRSLIKQRTIYFHLDLGMFIVMRKDYIRYVLINWLFIIYFNSFNRYSYGEPVPYRFSNEAYLAKLIVPLRSVADHIRNISYYNEPAKKFTGRGHLACVHYSGNKAFSSRRPLYKELSIRDDVNLLSFYAKNRLAAAGLAIEGATAGGAPEQPTAAQCA